MVEMYTVQRFLDPEGLKSRGLEHFDAWAATFGEVIDTMEIAPDGKERSPSKPSRSEITNGDLAGEDRALG